MKEYPIEVHVWVDTTPFAVMVYIDREDQKGIVNLMEACHRQRPFSTKAMCGWCVLFDIRYKIIPPFNKDEKIELRYLKIRQDLMELKQDVIFSMLKNGNNGAQDNT